MLERYKTIKEAGTNEIEIKGSRFIAQFIRVHNEEEALEFIQAIKKEHWKATHNCSAFLIGENDQIQRAMDDGEPSGTAGVPMLEVLKKNELKDVAVVVTRYFGGTKLGAGGLVRAYSGAVSEGLKAIGIVECRLEEQLSLRFDYSHVGKVEYYCQTKNVPIVDKVFADYVEFICSLSIDSLGFFKDDIIDLLQNQVTFSTVGAYYTEYLLTPSQGE